MTKILGVYAGHDAHFCLLQSGEVTHHYVANRWTRVKRSSGWFEHILFEMLEDANVSWGDIDIVASGGCRWDKDQMPVSLPSTTNLFDKLQIAKDKFLQLTSHRNNPAYKACNEDPLERLAVDKAEYEGHHVQIYQIDHHLSHAAQAYYTGPYTDALAFSFDGGGDGAFMLSAHGKENQLRNLEYNDGKIYPDRPSIGNTWSLTIRDLYEFPGGPTDAEGKLMGHAAYGVPRTEFVEVVRAMMLQGYEGRKKIQEEFERLRGVINFSDFHSQDLMDYSASVQLVTEQIMVEVIQARMQKEDTQNIALSGGVAYNCCANNVIFNHCSQNLFVSNCPNDAGLAVGAVLFIWHHVLNNEFKGIKRFNPFKGKGNHGTEDTSVADQVVDDLLKGEIVAWFNGRAENGARALGHRSILADPRLPNIKDIINQKVKKREWFRPFAPSVVSEHTGWCKGPIPPSYYMSFAVDMVKTWVDLLPGVAHVDGTCRPQVVCREDNPVYWEIINRFWQATGVPMILNTSFNIQEPIVETEEQARHTFARSGMDALYINGVKQ